MAETGTSWLDLITAYLGYRNAKDVQDKRGDTQVKPLTPQEQWVFDYLKGLTQYSPTRDYLSEYSHQFLSGMNAPGGIADWKPEFKSDYMKGNELPSMPKVDMSQLPTYWRKDFKNASLPGTLNPNGLGPGATMLGRQRFNQSMTMPNGDPWSGLSFTYDPNPTRGNVSNPWDPSNDPSQPKGLQSGMSYASFDQFLGDIKNVLSWASKNLPAAVPLITAFLSGNPTAQVLTGLKWLYDKYFGKPAETPPPPPSNNNPQGPV